MRYLLPCLLLTAACHAQEATFDEAFFAGDGREVLSASASRLEALKPKDAKCMAEAGRFYFLAGDTRKGEEMMRFAELLDPKDAEVQRLIGRGFLHGGRKSQALAAYEKVLNQEHASSKILALAAIDLAEAGLAKDARRFMDAFVIRENNDWETFIAFGRAYLKTGNRKAASPWFHRAVVLKPSEERVFQEIGRAFSETSTRK